MRLRMDVLSWHSNSSCSLLVCLSIVPLCVLRLLSCTIRTARHLFVRVLPSSSMRIHCIPSVAWLIRVAGVVLPVSRFCRKISLIMCGMLIAHSSPCQPSSRRSSISSLYFSSFFNKGGVVLTSPRTTTPGSEGCFRKFLFCLSITSVGKEIYWRPPPPLSVWLCPFL